MSGIADGESDVNHLHTQKAPLHLLSRAFGVAAAGAAWSTRGEEWPKALILAGVSALMFVLGLCFGTLTVQDEGRGSWPGATRVPIPKRSRLGERGRPGRVLAPSRACRRNPSRLLDSLNARGRARR